MLIRRLRKLLRAVKTLGLLTHRDSSDATSHGSASRCCLAFGLLKAAKAVRALGAIQPPFWVFVGAVLNRAIGFPSMAEFRALLQTTPPPLQRLVGTSVANDFQGSEHLTSMLRSCST